MTGSEGWDTGPLSRIKGDRWRVTVDRSGKIKIIEFDTIGSTNASVKDYIRGGVMRAPFCLLARTQTGGVGRHGRPYYCPAGGVYMTLALSEADFKHAFGTGFVALCLHRVIERFLTVKKPSEKKPPTSIKWVNDIYLGDKKVAGVLIEKSGGNFVIGVGVNLRQTEPVPAELGGKMGFLDLDIPPRVFTEELIREITTARLTAGQVISEYLVHCNIVGTYIKTAHACGTVTSMNLDGSLNVESGGKINTVYTAD
jgi:BirA family biotin operon repressor/biotin-[acetyl-CoA-carboxylase] ligase